MPKKSPAPKKKSPTARKREAQLPHDHALEALLSYIDGNEGDQRPLIAIADQVLAAAPASFHGERDIPNVFAKPWSPAPR